MEHEIGMSHLQQRGVDTSPPTNLTDRDIYIRPLTDCPGQIQDRGFTGFWNSRCGPTRNPRAYTVWCRKGPFGLAEGSATYDTQNYQGECNGDEVCFQHGIAGNAVAYCLNVVNAAHTYTLTQGQTGISGPPPAEGTNVPHIDETVISTTYSPTAPIAHRFELTLTGYDTQDTMYWAQNLNIQPMKGGKPLGQPTVCNDCVRSEVEGWPQDADGFEVDVVKKNPTDVDFWNLIYTVNISVGTPEQVFSLATTTADDIIVVPSARCKYFCSDTSNKYNSSLSSTFKPNGSYASTLFGETNYDGELAYDFIRLGGIELPAMAFEEWTSATCASIACFQQGYDGVLGLGPPWWKRRSIPSPLEVMLDRNVLDSPIFSLKLPRSEDEQGDLLFGASDPELYQAPLSQIPVLDLQDENPFSGLWTVPADHLFFNSTRPLIHTFNSSSAFAVLDSSSPYLILPDEIAANLSLAIGAQPGPYWFQNIPCSNRVFLPTLTVGLGGYNFTIDAFDYTLEVLLDKQIGSICLTTFWSRGQFWGDSPDAMLLGAPFMRGVYSVFDMERREIGLAKLER
ncbi:MAG: hypothetical protein Q9227_001769 [Pyrenula ochraceoflavens]